MLCAIACFAAWRRAKVHFTNFDLAALGYLAVGFLAMAVNGFSLPFSLPWIAVHLGALVVVVTAREATSQNRDALVDGLVSIGAIIALVALYEALGGSLPWETSRRPGATFANRNAVGGYCAILLPLALVRAAMRPHYLRSLAAALLMLTAALCRARSSWVGLLVASLVVIAVWVALWVRRGSPAPSRRGIIHACVTLVGTVVVLNTVSWGGLQWSEPTPFKSSFSRIVDYDSGTGRSRLEQHQVGLAMLSVKPWVGFGPGLWRREAPRFAHAATGKHARFIEPLWTPASDLLRHSVETGLLGLIAAAAMAFSLLVGSGRRVMQTQDMLSLATIGSLIVALVISGFDALLARPASVALVAAVAGMLRFDCASRAAFVSPRACGLVLSLAATVSLCIAAPQYLALKELSEDCSATTVLRLGPSRSLPLESLRAVAISEHFEDCSTLTAAATLLDMHLPYEPRLLHLLARCAEQQGRLEDARSFRRRAQDIEPHDMSVAPTEKDGMNRSPVEGDGLVKGGEEVP
ncbi:O-antigen ligase family protein [Myxococcus hansupus]|uniref:O-antigen ligase family protein n=1 Tax=Pseudomyxococcus hansupus TaxID=1297742 RepID=UPI00131448D5|nr:O-antigen ligase family protein [Myxococcus hansupus]